MSRSFSSSASILVLKAREISARREEETDAINELPDRLLHVGGEQLAPAVY
jgi:hypothetical protein